MMEHAFTVMLRAELTTASQNKLSALTQSALKLRPGVVARVLHNHVKQAAIEILPPALQLAEGLCRNAGAGFKNVFEAELPELFEEAWLRSDRAVRSQLLKLYVSWKNTLAKEVIGAIDARMKMAKTAKREPEVPAAAPIKRAKHEMPPAAYDDLSPSPIPMRSNNPPYWSRDQDPNIIHIESEEDSDSEDQMNKLPVMSLIEMLMKAAEQCKQTPQTNPPPQPTVRQTTNINFRNLHVYEEEVYKRLVQGSKATKPSYLDWRFHLRFERRKQNCQSRTWYAHPDVWAQDSDPKDLSPQQLLQKLSKPRSWKADDIIRVPIDDDKPQTHCAISGDLFEKRFDEKTGKWYYMHCRRLHREEARTNKVPDGSICLTDCIVPCYRT